MILFERTSFFRTLLLVAVLLLLAGCAWFQRPAPSTEPALVRLAVDDYPDFSDGFFLDNLSHGIGKSIEYLQRVPAERTFRFGIDTYDARHLKRSLEVLQALVERRPSPAEVNRFMARNFRVYRSTGGPESGRVLFTGYYEPHLKGSLKPDARYRYPVYARPGDLMVIDLTPFSEALAGKRIVGRIQGDTVVPYPDRQAIEADADFGRLAPPLAWVDDRIDLFFLQIQGSGRIYLAEGGFIRVHYHAANGRPYRSIGRLLIDQGKIPAEEMSMQRLRDYLRSHPEEMDAILNYNPSYVFFKTETSGPIGAIGVDLTPARSVAVDRRVFPMAAPAFLQTQIPVVDGTGRIDRWMDFSAFALNQDTGGAIRGPGRVDIFWGNGPYARIAAGHMQHKGNFYLLVLDPESKVSAAIQDN
ncbi:MltA domain-containing protein [uncultured Desulfosarcina sp.]|uniref:murein transglycosylase A n=1 Tax=uncultured Desulfosarcina sp. TaxID=218289 RepID=UPI0029C7697F|nr:MltA domain-containing protein [uncultured Desulfosarcina sp.]